MGRRSLPKIDTTVDLSRHHREALELPAPIDWAALFARPNAPLEIEVGSGKGLFLVGASRTFPDRNFLGIEIAAKYARFTAYRLARVESDNALMLHGDAQRFFVEKLADGVAAAVHVYFPDPWWKKRHHKRRIMNPAFVAQIERVLAPDGRLHFWTDVREYFDEALATLASHTRLSGPIEPAEIAPSHDLDYRTHFERRTRLHGAPVYRAELKRLG